MRIVKTVIRDIKLSFIPESIFIQQGHAMPHTRPTSFMKYPRSAAIDVNFNYTRTTNTILARQYYRKAIFIVAATIGLLIGRKRYQNTIYLIKSGGRTLVLLSWRPTTTFIWDTTVYVYINVSVYIEIVSFFIYVVRFPASPLEFQRLVISCFQFTIWLKYR